MPHDGAVSAHYTRGALGDAILAGLRALGKDPDRLAWDDLVGVDQFHARGRDATFELAALAGVQGGERVLDIGGGLGGPARALAATFGCRVTVLDVTEEYCRVGEMLTRRTGLSHLVTFCACDALSAPFSDESFDLAWTQHSSMNVADKGALYGEIHRVTRRGGRLALHEVVAGDAQPPHFPVPWARTPAISFLQSGAAVRRVVAAAGFRELAWRDESVRAGEWYRARAAALARRAAPPLGLQLLLGADAAPSIRNLGRNVEERRLAVVAAAFERC